MIMNDKIKEECISKLTEIINIEKEAINFCRKLKFGEVRVDLECYNKDKHDEIKKLLKNIVHELNYEYMDFYFSLDCDEYNIITITILDDYILTGSIKYDIECEPEICLNEINKYIDFKREIEPTILLKQILETKEGIAESDKIKIDNFYEYLIGFSYLIKVKREILNLNAQIHEMELRVKSYIFKSLMKFNI